jgi:hypothetical protein
VSPDGAGRGTCCWPWTASSSHSHQVGWRRSGECVADVILQVSSTASPPSRTHWRPKVSTGAHTTHTSLSLSVFPPFSFSLLSLLALFFFSLPLARSFALSLSPPLSSLASVSLCSWLCVEADSVSAGVCKPQLLRFTEMYTTGAVTLNSTPSLIGQGCGVFSHCICQSDHTADGDHIEDVRTAVAFFIRHDVHIRRSFLHVTSSSFFFLNSCFPLKGLFSSPFPRQTLMYALYSSNHSLSPQITLSPTPSLCPSSSLNLFLLVTLCSYSLQVYIPAYLLLGGGGGCFFIPQFHLSNLSDSHSLSISFPLISHLSGSAIKRD